MTKNGVLFLKTIDMKLMTQQVQYVYNIYAILISFYNKSIFSNF